MIFEPQPRFPDSRILLPPDIPRTVNSQLSFLGADDLRVADGSFSDQFTQLTWARDLLDKMRITSLIEGDDPESLLLITRNRIIYNPNFVRPDKTDVQIAKISDPSLKIYGKKDEFRKPLGYSVRPPLSMELITSERGKRVSAQHPSTGSAHLDGVQVASIIGSYKVRYDDLFMMLLDDGTGTVRIVLPEDKFDSDFVEINKNNVIGLEFQPVTSVTGTKSEFNHGNIAFLRRS